MFVQYQAQYGPWSKPLPIFGCCVRSHLSQALKIVIFNDNTDIIEFSQSLSEEQKNIHHAETLELN